MSDITTHLLLPYILALLAQKHATHNEAIRLFDAMVQLSVLDRDLTAPPQALPMATATSWLRVTPVYERVGI